MNSIDKKLRQYIKDNILPIYQHVDEGHNLENHIEPVINESLALASKLDNINLNIVYVVAAYHDIGLIHGRKYHHIYSKQSVLNDNALKKWFNEEEIKIIAEAVEDHRASLDKKPRSIYGMIISDSDKNVDLHEIILRTHLCIKTKYPDEDLSTFEKEFEKAYEWIIQKDSESGYLKFYLNKEKEEKLEKLHKQVKDKDYIREEYKKVYYMENLKKYNKLVRDKIPDKIKNNGEKPITRILDDNEYKIELEKKLHEELNEVLNSSGTDRIEELADMLEVMISLANIEGMNLEDIIDACDKKRNKNGGFQKKIFLDDVVGG